MTVKLTRTLAIIPITLVLAFVRTKRAKTDGTKVDLKKIFPMFILYFLLASVITTVCVNVGVSASVFAPLKTLSKFLIVMAMCAVGLNTNIVKLVKTGGKPIFCIDFQNDGEYIDGCIAGGRQYAHINPAGDVEPCVFIHYSNANIHDKSLLECLQQPLFKEYHKGQPFNGNHLRPCPMLENPQILGDMVRRSGAHSTDMQQPESPEDVFRRCRPYATSWMPTADRLWAEKHPGYVDPENPESANSCASCASCDACSAHQE